MTSKSILFADDNVHIREFCQRTFAEEGYRVVLARDGDEAVRLAIKEYFDLIILDVGMPSVTGLEAAQRIKTVCPCVPIVFFTAHDKGRFSSGFREFAVACVEKTEDLTELKQVVARLTGNCLEHLP
jgi:CheY-like chemotaxis protein